MEPVKQTKTEKKYVKIIGWMFIIVGIYALLYREFLGALFGIAGGIYYAYYHKQKNVPAKIQDYLEKKGKIFKNYEFKNEINNRIITIDSNSINILGRIWLFASVFNFIAIVITLSVIFIPKFTEFSDIIGNSTVAGIIMGFILIIPAIILSIIPYFFSRYLSDIETRIRIDNSTINIDKAKGFRREQISIGLDRKPLIYGEFCDKVIYYRGVFITSGKFRYKLYLGYFEDEFKKIELRSGKIFFTNRMGLLYTKQDIIKIANFLGLNFKVDKELNEIE